MKSKNLTTLFGILTGVTVFAFFVFINVLSAADKRIEYGTGYKAVEYSGDKPVIDYMIDKIGSLESQMKALGAGLDPLNTQLDILNGNIAALGNIFNDNIDRIEGGFDSLKSDIDAGEFGGKFSVQIALDAIGCKLGEVLVPHGEYKTFYKSGSCDSQLRGCNLGELSGSGLYNRASCN